MSDRDARGSAWTLVVGGAGYLGQPLVELLLEHGRPVRVFDRLAFGAGGLDRFAGLPGFELVRGDVRALGSVSGMLDGLFAGLFEGVGAVVHLAALSDETSCALDPRVTEQVNVTATALLADCASAAGVARLVFASSAGVYVPGSEPSDERAPVAPCGLYSTSKLAAERRLAESATAGLGVVVLRLATLYGWSPRMRFDTVVNQMTRDAAAAGRIRVEQARTWRPLLHVRDAARGILLALDAPDARVRGELFNLGADDQNLRIGELAEAVRRRLPAAVVELHGAGDDAAATRACAGYRLDSGRIRERLGFAAERTLADGIDEIARALADGAAVDPSAAIHHNARRWAELRALPAADGGEPARSAPLPFALPSLGVEEEAEVVDTLRSGWLTAGPKTRRFEERFAERVGAAHAVATSSCTAALQLALAALGIGPDDEVITSPITFPATANVILHQGARPVFVDVDPRTLNLDVARLESARTPRTRAVIPVHFAGNPCPMDPIRAFAAAHGLAVIEDAAHAIGARLGGRPVGALGEATCFSFYPIKNMTAAEGGMLTTDDTRIAARARLLGSHGVTRDAWSRHGPAGELHWETVAAGFKANMTDLQAAIGLAQLGKLDGFLARRRELAARYAEAFTDLAELRLLGTTPGGESAHHLLVVLLELDRLRIDRDGFALALRAEGIGVGIHFRSLHLHRFYRDLLGDLDDRLPVATDVSRRLLSLPLYPAMTDQDCDDAIRAVRKLSIFYRVARA